MEPLAIMGEAIETARGFGPVPKLQQRERPIGRLMEQAVVADRHAGEEKGGSSGGTPVPRPTVGCEEIVAPVPRLVADRLVERGRQHQRGPAPPVPGGLPAGPHWEAARRPP